MSELLIQNPVQQTQCTEALDDTFISIHLVLELNFDLYISSHRLVPKLPDNPWGFGIHDQGFKICS